MYTFYNGLKYYGSQNVYNWNSELENFPGVFNSIDHFDLNRNTKGICIESFKSNKEVSEKIKKVSKADCDVYHSQVLTEQWSGESQEAIRFRRNANVEMSPWTYKLFEKIGSLSLNKEEQGYIKSKQQYIDLADEQEYIIEKKEIYYETLY